MRLLIGTFLLASLTGCTELSMRLNTEGALKSLRLLSVAEELYRAKPGHIRYGTLRELYEERLIDAELASGTKAGYRFELTPLETSFRLTAVPIQHGTTGYGSFYLDESGLIRGHSENREPNVNDSPIGPQ